MEPTDAGTLVRISGSGPDADGIVFDAPSRSKIIVAVVDRARGPVFRTVHPDALGPRAEAGADDPALTQLIRRTPPPAHGAAVRGSSGHARAAMHRTTGK